GLAGDFRTDESPSVIVYPSFGVVDPLRRAHLAECLDEPGVVLGATVVVASEDAPYDAPRQLDGLVGRSLVVAVDDPVLVNLLCHMRQPPSPMLCQLLCQLLFQRPFYNGRLTLVALGRLDAQEVGQFFRDVELPLHLALWNVAPCFVLGHQAATSSLATVPSAAMMRSCAFSVRPLASNRPVLQSYQTLALFRVNRICRALLLLMRSPSSSAQLMLPVL